jgi:hypothetical protein
MMGKEQHLEDPDQHKRRKTRQKRKNRKATKPTGQEWRTKARWYRLEISSHHRPWWLHWAHRTKARWYGLKWIMSQRVEKKSDWIGLVGASLGRGNWTGGARNPPPWVNQNAAFCTRTCFRFLTLFFCVFFLILLSMVAYFLDLDFNGWVCYYCYF